MDHTRQTATTPKKFLTKILATLIICIFSSTTLFPPSLVSAQFIPNNILNLPAPGALLPVSNGFIPANLRGITIHPENPLLFDFIVQLGDSNLAGDDLKEESRRLIKYFLAALTVPEEQMWVNLSPYEQDRIISETFGQTEMGRDLLAQDYLLKQLSASLVYPEDDLGQSFWNRVYSRAQAEYGTTDIPMNTFNKVWIVPETAVIYEKDNSAILLDSHLRVMLEEDYLALRANAQNDVFGLQMLDGDDQKVVSGITSEVIREIVIPEIEREINSGETFANLRQIFHSMIFATWYKQNLKESLLGQVYVNQNRVKGVDLKDPADNEKIYNQYLEAFRTGVYDYIREDIDPVTAAVIPRKYFSGGTAFASLPTQLTVHRGTAGRPLPEALIIPAQDLAGSPLALVKAFGMETSASPIAEQQLARAVASSPEDVSAFEAELNAEDVLTIAQRLQDSYGLGLGERVDVPQADPELTVQALDFRNEQIPSVLGWSTLSLLQSLEDNKNLNTVTVTAQNGQALAVAQVLNIFNVLEKDQRRLFNLIVFPDDNFSEKDRRELLALSSDRGLSIDIRDGYADYDLASNMAKNEAARVNGGAQDGQLTAYFLDTQSTSQYQGFTALALSILEGIDNQDQTALVIPTTVRGLALGFVEAKRLLNSSVELVFAQPARSDDKTFLDRAIETISVGINDVLAARSDLNDNLIYPRSAGVLAYAGLVKEKNRLKGQGITNIVLVNPADVVDRIRDVLDNVAVHDPNKVLNPGNAFAFDTRPGNLNEVQRLLRLAPNGIIGEGFDEDNRHVLSQAGKIFLAAKVSALLGDPNQDFAFGKQVKGVIYQGVDLKFNNDNWLDSLNQPLKILAQIRKTIPIMTKDGKFTRTADVFLDVYVVDANGDVLAEGESKMWVPLTEEQTTDLDLNQPRESAERISFLDGETLTTPQSQQTLPKHLDEFTETSEDGNVFHKDRLPELTQTAQYGAFGQRIAHGILGVNQIVIRLRALGLFNETILQRMNFQFKAPVYPWDEIRVKTQVNGVDGQQVVTASLQKFGKRKPSDTEKQWFDAIIGTVTLESANDEGVAGASGSSGLPVRQVNRVGGQPLSVPISVLNNLSQEPETFFQNLIMSLLDEHFRNTDRKQGGYVNSVLQRTQLPAYVTPPVTLPDPKTYEYLQYFSAPGANDHVVAYSEQGIPVADPSAEEGAGTRVRGDMRQVRAALQSAGVVFQNDPSYLPAVMTGWAGNYGMNWQLHDFSPETVRVNAQVLKEFMRLKEDSLKKSLGEQFELLALAQRALENKTRRLYGQTQEKFETLFKSYRDQVLQASVPSDPLFEVDHQDLVWQSLGENRNVLQARILSVVAPRNFGNQDPSQQVLNVSENSRALFNDTNDESVVNVNVITALLDRYFMATQTASYGSESRVAAPAFLSKIGSGSYYQLVQAEGDLMESSIQPRFRAFQTAFEQAGFVFPAQAKYAVSSTGDEWFISDFTQGFNIERSQWNQFMQDNRESLIDVLGQDNVELLELSAKALPTRWFGEIEEGRWKSEADIAEILKYSRYLSLSPEQKKKFEAYIEQFSRAEDPLSFMSQQTLEERTLTPEIVQSYRQMIFSNATAQEQQRIDELFVKFQRNLIGPFRRTVETPRESVENFVETFQTPTGITFEVHAGEEAYADAYAQEMIEHLMGNNSNNHTTLSLGATGGTFILIWKKFIEKLEAQARINPDSVNLLRLHLFNLDENIAPEGFQGDWTQDSRAYFQYMVENVYRPLERISNKYGLGLQMDQMHVFSGDPNEEVYTAGLDSYLDKFLAIRRMLEQEGGKVFGNFGLGVDGHLAFNGKIVQINDASMKVLEGDDVQAINQIQSELRDATEIFVEGLNEEQKLTRVQAVLKIHEQMRQGDGFLQYVRDGVQAAAQLEASLDGQDKPGLDILADNLRRQPVVIYVEDMSRNLKEKIQEFSGELSFPVTALDKKEINAKVRIVELHLSAIIQNSRYNSNLADTTTKAATVGLGFIMEFVDIVRVAVNKSTKAPILKEIAEGWDSLQLPATILRQHPGDVKFIVDSAAAQLISSEQRQNATREPAAASSATGVLIPIDTVETTPSLIQNLIQSWSSEGRLGQFYAALNSLRDFVDADRRWEDNKELTDAELKKILEPLTAFKSQSYFDRETANIRHIVERHIADSQILWQVANSVTDYLKGTLATLRERNDLSVEVQGSLQVLGTIEAELAAWLNNKTGSNLANYTERLKNLPKGTGATDSLDRLFIIMDRRQVRDYLDSIAEQIDVLSKRQVASSAGAIEIRGPEALLSLLSPSFTRSIQGLGIWAAYNPSYNPMLFPGMAIMFPEWSAPATRVYQQADSIAEWVTMGQEDEAMNRIGEHVFQAHMIHMANYWIYDFHSGSNRLKKLTDEFLTIFYVELFAAFENRVGPTTLSRALRNNPRFRLLNNALGLGDLDPRSTLEEEADWSSDNIAELLSDAEQLTEKLKLRYNDENHENYVQTSELLRILLELRAVRGLFDDDSKSQTTALSQTRFPAFPSKDERGPRSSELKQIDTLLSPVATELHLRIRDDDTLVRWKDLENPNIVQIVQDIETGMTEARAMYQEFKRFVSQRIGEDLAQKQTSPVVALALLGANLERSERGKLDSEVPKLKQLVLRRLHKESEQISLDRRFKNRSTPDLDLSGSVSENLQTIHAALSKSQDLHNYQLMMDYLAEQLQASLDEAASASSAAVGGIDFNSELMNLQIKRDAQGVPLPVWQQPLENMNVEGFVPVIINITPMTNMPLLLGLADTENTNETAEIHVETDILAREIEAQG